MKASMTKAPDARPKTFPRRAPSKALALGLLAALLSAAASPAWTKVAPQEEVMDTARTPAGELSLVRRREGEAVTVLIKLNGRVVAEKGASAEGEAYDGAAFYGLYPKGAPRYALVGLSTGALVCGAKYTVVDLSREEPARVSRDFGNCSDAPRVAYRRGTLTVAFPAGPKKRDPGAHYVGPGQVWSYGNGRLRMVGGRR
jgi:hypothetical protein